MKLTILEARKAKIRELADLVSDEGSFLGLWMAAFSRCPDTVRGETERREGRRKKREEEEKSSLLGSYFSRLGIWVGKEVTPLTPSHTHTLGPSP